MRARSLPRAVPACRRCRIGSRNAAVLPVPVDAQPIRSRPARITGIASAWIGVGRVYPMSRTASASGGMRWNSESRLTARAPADGSPVPAAPTSTAGRVAGRRGSAPHAASVSFDRPGFFPDLDRARVDELLERRVFDVVRGYLSALSRSQVQRLAAGQGNAQGLYGLVGDGRHDSLCCLALLANVGVTPYALAADVDRRAGDQLTRVLALAAEGAAEARLLLTELFSEVQMPQRLSPDVLLRDHPVAQVQALVADVHGRRTRKQRDLLVSDAAERTGITLHGGNPCRSYPQLDV